MSEDEFWDMTPKVFYLKSEGFFELLEMREQFEWERVRFQTVALINSERKRHQQIRPQQLVKFGWEKKEHKKNEKDKIDYIIHKAKK
mgnify:CR=1 FL=1|tara:strand:- start:572 stop:832 length:261 start_codon:yes stop_codon:yes gene_type:complete